MTTDTRHHLFPATVPEGEICQFSAEGFTEPACGVIYNGGRAASGVPLGGLGTGYIELNADGTLGETTIFNAFPKPRDLATPLLGLAVGSEVRVLTMKPPAGMGGAQGMSYWGHYPVADVKFNLDLPVQVSLRAFTPFIPGDAAASNTPAAVFDLRLANDSAEPQEVRLAMTFPGPEPTDGERFERDPYGNRQGAVVSSQRFGRRVGYALVVAGDAGPAAVGPALKSNEDWVAVTGDVQAPLPTEPGTSIVVPVRVPAHGHAQVRFVLAWYYPDFRIGFSYHHMYGRRFAGVEDVVRLVLRDAPNLLRRTLAWQEVLYTSSDLPVWLRDALVNSLYSLAKNSWWNYSDRPDDWWGDIGLFTHSESFTGCPITETMVCRFHGHFPTLFFFPELEKTTLRAFAHYQLKSGEIPFCFGRPAGLYDPRYTCQHPLNSSQFVQLVYRYFCRTGDEAFLREMLPIVKDAVTYLRSLDTDGDGLVNDHPHALPGEIWPANQFYDIWPWYGTSAYVAGTWLATLRCAEAMARHLNDDQFARDCRTWLANGLESFNAKLWNGRYYRVYADPENGRVSDVSLANQLMGEWCSRVVGLDGLFESSKVASALEAVARLNVRAGEAVMVNGVNPDGTPHRSRADGHENDHASGCFVGENLCSAMTMLYAGQRELGLDIARRIYEAIAIRHRTPWDQYCIIAPSDGHPIWGSDYYSNLVIWALPMALAGQGIAELASPGGLLERILEAGAVPTSGQA